MLVIELENVGFTHDGMKLPCRNMHAGSRSDALLHKRETVLTPVIHPAMR